MKGVPLTDEQKTAMADGRRRRARQRREAPAPSAPEVGGGFEAFLADVSQETRDLVGIEGLRAAYDENLKAEKEARRILLRRQASEKAKMHAKIALGTLSSGEIENERRRAHGMEPVTIRIPMAVDSSDYGLRVNGKLFRWNTEHTVTRDEAVYLRSLVFGAQQMQLNMRGEGVTGQHREMMNARFGEMHL